MAKDSQIVICVFVCLVGLWLVAGRKWWRWS